MLLDGKAFAGELTLIADGRATFAWKGQGPSLQGLISDSWPLDEIVRWGNPVNARPHTIVVLADDGQIVTAADWSGGAAVRIDDDSIVVRSDALGEVRVPRNAVLGVVFALQSHPADRAQLVERVRAETSPADTPNYKNDADVVLLTNRDTLSGKVSELAGGSLTIDTEAGAAKLPLSRIEAVEFGNRQAGTAGRHAKLAVGMRDGSLLYVDRITTSEAGLILQSGGGVKFEVGKVADIVALQSLGDRLAYLSDIEPADFRHAPYLSIEWPYRRDRNVLGERLTVGGTNYLKGIGMHSASRLTYRLDGKFSRFDAAVALDDAAKQGGSVTFAVYVVRDGKLQEAFKSDIVRGGAAPQPVSVDVSGAEALVLTVDFADRGDELDRADWLDARLVKE